MKQLGDILLEGGLVTQAQLQAAYDEHQRAGRALGRVLVDQGVLTEAQLVAALAQQIGMRFVELGRLPGRPLRRRPGLRCARAGSYVVLPFGFEDGKLLLAMADPANFLAIEDVRAVTQMEVKPVRRHPHRRARRDRPVLPGGQRPRGHHRASSTSRRRRTSPRSARRSRTPRSSSTSTRSSPRRSRTAPRTSTSSRPSATCASGTASTACCTRSCARPKTIQSGVISRLKIMADINIAERRIPQDGRMSINANGKKIDLRVATLPTVWGEKVVMRILDNSTARLDLDRPRLLRRQLRALLAQLHQAVRDDPGHRARPAPASRRRCTRRSTSSTAAEVNIITVEDPVEYRLPGVNQVQVNNKAGLTFASALRSILRSDPDIVLIGEIRDHETAQIAVEAALTGHLVLSTLHTNDAPSAITRLTEMGIEPFLVGSAVDCVARPAARPAAVHQVQGGVRPDARRRSSPARFPWQDGEPLPDAVPRRGLLVVREDRLQGPARPARGHAR